MQINSKQLTSKNNWLQLQVTVKGNWLLFHLLLNCVIVTVGRFLLVGGKNVFSMDKNRGGKNSFAGKNRFCHINCGPICQNIGKNPKLECGPMPNLMVALPNIGGALCSTPQSLADAHY